MKKKIMITGSSGMLGSNIVHEIGEKYEIYGIYRSLPNIELQNQFRIDLSDSKRVKKIIDAIKPDYVVHCAALSNVEECEEDYGLAYKNNVLALKNLLCAIDSNVRFIFISTDSVFDGSKGNYDEVDLPMPLNNYAKTKLEGERFVEQMSNNYRVVRTNFFGWNRIKGESFAEWILNNLSKSQRINMFKDVIFSPITANSLSLFIDKLFSLDFIGRLNIASDGCISKYAFGNRLAELFGFNGSLINPISIDEFNFKAKRPKNITLDITKAKSIFEKLPKIDDELREFYNKRVKYL